jgi:hypothetical protein
MKKKGSYQMVKVKLLDTCTGPEDVVTFRVVQKGKTLTGKSWKGKGQFGACRCMDLKPVRKK